MFPACVLSRLGYDTVRFGKCPSVCQAAGSDKKCGEIAAREFDCLLVVVRAIRQRMYKSMSTVEDALTLSNLGTFLKVGGRLRVPDSTGDFGVAPSASVYDALWKQPST